MVIDSLKKRYILKLLANIIFGIVNALLVAIIPKALGPVAYGQFNFLQQLYNQFISFIDANSSTAFFTKLSANNSRYDLIIFYFLVSSLIFLITLLTSLFIDFGGAANYVFPDVERKYIYLGMLFCLLTWLNQVFIKISDAYAITVPVEIVKIIHKISMLFIVFIIISDFYLDLERYFYFNILSLLVLLMLLLVIFKRKHVFDSEINFKNIKFRAIFEEFYVFCSPLFIFNLIAIAIGIFDIWLLQKVSGSVEVGFYGLSYSISAMCFLFTSAMTPIIMREFSQSIEQNDIDNVRKLFSRYVPMLYAISAYFSVFVAFHAEDLLLIFTDARYEGAYMALVIMAFYPLHQTYGQINTALIFSAGKITFYKNIGLLFSFFGLILSCLFIYLLKMGAEGMAWKMFVVQIISVNVQLLFNAKYLNVRVASFIIHQIVCVFVFSIIAYVTKVLLFDNVIINFLISGFIYTIIVFCCAFYFPNAIGIFKKKIESSIG
ncbi:lipopolysaccharide biosynthesis protein [Shewanella baltica]|uniref:lipopolysaccharide biosynthesis protein n=1 Tax=Shewanella baltica TaxID=62322 RepID=UPI003D7A292A